MMTLKLMAALTRGLLRRLKSMRLSLALSVVCCCAILHVAYEFLLYNSAANDQPQSSQALSDEDGNCLFQDSTFALRNTKLQKDLIAGIAVCPTVKRPWANNERTSANWQHHETINSTMIVYSAFYDDRPAVGLTPLIRIQGVASFPSVNSTVYCHIWFNGCSSPYVTQGSYIITGRKRGYVINNKKYAQFMFSCRLPGSDPVPSHVSLVAADRCSSSSIYLPVERTIRSEPDHEFGVCVAISFGSIPVAEFVEWIEFNRLLGVTEFNIYDAGMVNMSAVFDYYMKQGILKVHTMPPPVPVHTSIVRSPLELRLKRVSGTMLDSIKLSSPASLNDCLLRNVYRYRYVVIIDFDEVIVPRLHANYSQMMQHLQQKARQHQSVVSYAFRNAYFFLNFQPDDSQPSYMRSLRYRHRAGVSPFKMAPKSFVNPRSCLSVFNHFCFVPMDSSDRNLGVLSVMSTIYDVNFDLAMSHHYRKCDFATAKCEVFFKQKIRDDAAMKFRAKLQTAILLVLKALGHHVLE